ncbi:metalloprotease PmbA [Atopomonas sediminilitoris]|uniref:metalloprotease PmbA n=1 Tax=Atopomonas sediminilitoris TaxID=2919919 RepID=UPI001F4DDDB4|nr:metalloprotease PmbA [Atopomonas sediminilitoris]MCJ8169972.1 metalloprotease PmbA [Atopomonas sediminilitoris]
MGSNKQQTAEHAAETQGVGPQDLPRLQSLVAEIVAQAKQQGATACEVGVSVNQGLAVNVRRGEVETLEFNRDQGFAITVYSGQRKGSASTSDTSASAIKQAVEAALVIAKHASEDPCAGLADANQMAQQLPDLDLYHAWDLHADQAIELAQQMEEAAFAVDPRLSNSDGASVNLFQGCRVYGNSHGFIGGYAGTRHSMSCVMIAEANVNGERQMQRDYWYDVNRQSQALQSAQAIGQKAAQRTVARLGARAVPTAQVPVLFAPEVAAGLLGHFLAAISGGNLYRKSSFLEGALGQRLFPDWLNIDERPHLPSLLGSSSFDNDGLATRAQSFVQGGELVSYLLSVYSARKLGMTSTANAGGAHNLFVSHGDADQQALLKQMGRGLLVTELMGQGVNMVTGDYSRGAGGYWVENGEIQFPVQEVTIAGNLRDIFANVAAIGNDVDTRGNIRTGSILIEQMTLAGS